MLAHVVPSWMTCPMSVAGRLRGRRADVETWGGHDVDVCFRRAGFFRPLSVRIEAVTAFGAVLGSWPWPTERGGREGGRQKGWRPASLSISNTASSVGCDAGLGPDPRLALGPRRVIMGPYRLVRPVRGVCGRQVEAARSGSAAPRAAAGNVWRRAQIPVDGEFGNRLSRFASADIGHRRHCTRGGGGDRPGKEAGEEEEGFWTNAERRGVQGTSLLWGAWPRPECGKDFLKCKCFRFRARVFRKNF